MNGATGDWRNVPLSPIQGQNLGLRSNLTTTRAAGTMTRNPGKFHAYLTDRYLSSERREEEEYIQGYGLVLQGKLLEMCWFVPYQIIFRPGI